MSKPLSFKIHYFFILSLIVLLLTQCSKKNYYQFSFKQNEFASLTAKDTPNVIIEAVSPTDESELTNLQKRELMALAGKLESDIVFKPDTIKIIRYNNERAPKRELFEKNIDIRETLEDLNFNEPEKINRADTRAILGFSIAAATMLFLFIPAIASFTAISLIFSLVYSIQGLKAMKKRNRTFAKIGLIISSLYIFVIGFAIYLLFSIF